jgi:hypothetical protein
MYCVSSEFRSVMTLVFSQRSQDREPAPQLNAYQRAIIEVSSPDRKRYAQGEEEARTAKAR